MSIKPQIKPCKLPENIYLLLENGKYVGRTTDLKNVIHFAERTSQGKLKVEVDLLTDNSLEKVDLEMLKSLLKKENYKAGVEKRQATLAKKKLEAKASVNGLPAGSYGIFS